MRGLWSKIGERKSQVIYISLGLEHPPIVHCQQVPGVSVSAAGAAGACERSSPTADHCGGGFSDCACNYSAATRQGLPGHLQQQQLKPLCVCVCVCVSSLSRTCSVPPTVAISRCCLSHARYWTYLAPLCYATLVEFQCSALPYIDIRTLASMIRALSSLSFTCYHIRLQH